MIDYILLSWLGSGDDFLQSITGFILALNETRHRNDANDPRFLTRLVDIPFIGNALPPRYSNVTHKP